MTKGENNDGYYKEASNSYTYSIPDRIRLRQCARSHACKEDQDTQRQAVKVINLIKSGLYQIKRSRVMLWVIITSVVLCAVAVHSELCELDAYRAEYLTDPSSYDDSDELYFSSGIWITDSDGNFVEAYYNDGAEEILRQAVRSGEISALDLTSIMLFSNSILMFMTLAFVLTFLCDDFRMGYVKNLAGKLPKFRIASARLLTCLIAQAAEFITVITASAIASAVSAHFSAANMTLAHTDVKAFVRVAAAQYLFYAAFTSIVFTVVMLVRSTAWSTAIAMFFAIGFSSLGYQITDIFLHTYCGFPKKFAVGKYMPDTMIRVFSSRTPIKQTAVMITAAAAFIIVFSLLGAWINKKRDL